MANKSLLFKGTFAFIGFFVTALLGFHNYKKWSDRVFVENFWAQQRAFLEQNAPKNLGRMPASDTNNSGATPTNSTSSPQLSQERLLALERLGLTLDTPLYRGVGPETASQFMVLEGDNRVASFTNTNSMGDFIPEQPNHFINDQYDAHRTFGHIFDPPVPGVVESKGIPGNFFTTDEALARNYAGQYGVLVRTTVREALAQGFSIGKDLAAVTPGGRGGLYIYQTPGTTAEAIVGALVSAPEGLIPSRIPISNQGTPNLPDLSATQERIILADGIGNTNSVVTKIGNVVEKEVKQGDAVARSLMLNVNRLASVFPGVVPPLSYVRDSTLQQNFSEGLNYSQVQALGADKGRRAMQEMSKYIAKARVALGQQLVGRTLSEFELIDTPEGTSLLVDHSSENFRFDSEGRVISWFDPVQVDQGWSPDPSRGSTVFAAATAGSFLDPESPTSNAQDVRMSRTIGDLYPGLRRAHSNYQRDVGVLRQRAIQNLRGRNAPIDLPSLRSEIASLIVGDVSARNSHIQLLTEIQTALRDMGLRYRNYNEAFLDRSTGQKRNLPGLYLNGIDPQHPNPPPLARLIAQSHQRLGTHSLTINPEWDLAVSDRQGEFDSQSRVLRTNLVTFLAMDPHDVRRSLSFVFWHEVGHGLTDTKMIEGKNSAWHAYVTPGESNGSIHPSYRGGFYADEVRSHGFELRANDRAIEIAKKDLDALQSAMEKSDNNAERRNLLNQFVELNNSIQRRQFLDQTPRAEGLVGLALSTKEAIRGALSAPDSSVTVSYGLKNSVAVTFPAASPGRSAITVNLAGKGGLQLTPAERTQLIAQARQNLRGLEGATESRLRYALASLIRNEPNPANGVHTRVRNLLQEFHNRNQRAWVSQGTEAAVRDYATLAEAEIRHAQNEKRPILGLPKLNLRRTNNFTAKNSDPDPSVPGNSRTLASSVDPRVDLPITELSPGNQFQAKINGLNNMAGVAASPISAYLAASVTADAIEGYHYASDKPAYVADQTAKATAGVIVAVVVGAAVIVGLGVLTGGAAVAATAIAGSSTTGAAVLASLIGAVPTAATSGLVMFGGYTAYKELMDSRDESHKAYLQNYAATQYRRSADAENLSQLGSDALKSGVSVLSARYFGIRAETATLIANLTVLNRLPQKTQEQQRVINESKKAIAKNLAVLERIRQTLQGSYAKPEFLLDGTYEQMKETAAAAMDIQYIPKEYLGNYGIPHGQSRPREQFGEYILPDNSSTPETGTGGTSGGSTGGSGGGSGGSPGSNPAENFNNPASIVVGLSMPSNVSPDVRIVEKAMLDEILKQTLTGGVFSQIVNQTNRSQSQPVIFVENNQANVNALQTTPKDNVVHRIPVRVANVDQNGKITAVSWNNDGQVYDSSQNFGFKPGVNPLTNGGIVVRTDGYATTLTPRAGPSATTRVAGVDFSKGTTAIQGAAKPPATSAQNEPPIQIVMPFVEHSRVGNQTTSVIFPDRRISTAAPDFNIVGVTSDGKNAIRVMDGVTTYWPISNSGSRIDNRNIIGVITKDSSGAKYNIQLQKFNGQTFTDSFGRTYSQTNVRELSEEVVVGRMPVSVTGKPSSSARPGKAPDGLRSQVRPTSSDTRTGLSSGQKPLVKWGEPL